MPLKKLSKMLHKYDKETIGKRNFLRENEPEFSMRNKVKECDRGITNLDNIENEASKIFDDEIMKNPTTMIKMIVQIRVSGIWKRLQLLI